MSLTRRGFFRLIAGAVTTLLLPSQSLVSRPSAYRRLMREFASAGIKIDRQPAAISIPFATLPREKYICGPRYLCCFEKIDPVQWEKDIETLADWVVPLADPTPQGV